jgi:hypothetical protein
MLPRLFGLLPNPPVGIWGAVVFEFTALIEFATVSEFTFESWAV